MSPSLPFRRLLLVLLLCLSGAFVARAQGATGGLPDGIELGRYYALVIGNNEYQNLPRLETAVSDAAAVAELLRAKYAFEDVALLLNATRRDILAALNRYRRDLGERDRLLIYYAGHGYLDRQLDRGYWLPVDADEDDDINWISNARLTDTLKGIAARHVIVIADSCYSGSLARSIGETGAPVGEDRGAWLARVSAKRSRTVLSSGSLEPVTDSGSGGHSLFAGAFLDALRENDGLLDGDTLYDRIKGRVAARGEQQPRYESLRDAIHEGGDFILVPRQVLQGGGQAGAPPAAEAPKVAVGIAAPPRRPGDRFRDCEDCPELVVLPDGIFRMGAPQNAGWSFPDEKPQHRVRIPERFAMARREITVGQFRAFVAATNRTIAPGCRTFDGSTWQPDPARSWQEPGFPQGADNPVVCVSWEDAVAYAQWLAARTGLAYRLPSEAEFEYAARAGSDETWPWGRDPGKACDFANVHDLTGNQVNRFAITPHDCDDEAAATAAVGWYRANAFDLYDVIGNAGEWVADCWRGDYEGAAGDAAAFERPDCDKRATRGGSWASAPWMTRPARRLHAAPDDRFNDLGFRVVRDLER